MSYNELQNITLIAGNANIPLAKTISTKLKIPLLKTDITRFSDGEVRVELLESVRGTNVYVIQATSAPTNDNIMELLLIIDAAKRAGCHQVHAIIPYYGYSRQDRKHDKERCPISSRVIANLLEAVGVDSIITVDIHSTQQLGFFAKPAINISASMEIMTDIWKNCEAGQYIIVSPDIGGVGRARATAKMLDNCDLAIIDKRRPAPNVSEVMNIIGDVQGKKCILIDDMIDTAGTLCKAADALMSRGATEVVAYCTHAILSGKAIDNINNSSLTQVVVSDTIQHKKSMLNNEKIRVFSVAGIIAETIYRLNTHQSVTEIQ